MPPFVSILKQAINPGGQYLDLTRAVTWQAYMKMTQEEFMDVNVPIFSFEKSPQVSLADSGLGEHLVKHHIESMVLCLWAKLR